MMNTEKLLFINYSWRINTTSPFLLITNETEQVDLRSFPIVLILDTECSIA